jgi:hypothetical protein
MTHWFLIISAWIPFWAILALLAPEASFLRGYLWFIDLSLPVLFILLVIHIKYRYEITSLKGAPYERTMLDGWTFFDVFTNWITHGTLLSNCGVSDISRLCLVVNGATSGKPRVIPLMTADIDRSNLGEYAGRIQGEVIAGSNMGAEKHPQWVTNIRAMIGQNKTVYYNFGQRIHSAVPEEITDPTLRERLFEEMMAFNPDFKRYIEDTQGNREIALFHLKRVKDFRWSDTVVVQQPDGNKGVVKISDLFFPHRSPSWIKKLKCRFNRTYSSHAIHEIA